MKNMTDLTILSKLLSEIKSQGYSKALDQFLKNNSEYEYRFNQMEGNIAFRVTQKNNTRCLVINSDLGNIPENISKIYDEVFAIEKNEEKISIQKYRFQDKNIKNIELIFSQTESFPFPDNFFDLIILNDIIIKKTTKSSKKRLLEYFNEMKRVLTYDGCLCVCTNNKFGLNIFGKEIIENDKDYEIFTDSFQGYNSFLKLIGLQVKSYWVLPSHKKPHHSGKIDDGISLKWFFQNFEKMFSTDRNLKVINIFLKGLNNTSRKFIGKNLFPSFVFYCYKNNIPETLEDKIIKETGFQNIVQNIRLTKVMYFLLDKFGKPKKVLSCKVTKYDLTEKIISVKRIFPKMNDPDEKIIMEDWLNGKPLDRLNHSDVNLAMKWLVDFQNKTSSEYLRLEEIENENISLKKILSKIEAVSSIPYERWIDEYEDHVSILKLKKTAVHGDLQMRNILVDKKKSAVNVIDWDWRFQEKGNPIYDFVWLGANIMMTASNMIEEFRENLKGTGKAVTSLKIVNDTMKEHVHTDLNFLILLRFMILRFVTIKIKDNGTGYLSYVELLKILNDERFLKFLKSNF